MTTTEYRDDGTVKVTVEQGGFKAIGFVSSAHLVTPKENQLLRALNGGIQDPGK